jgi:hypothetical protein
LPSHRPDAAACETKGFASISAGYPATTLPSGSEGPHPDRLEDNCGNLSHTKLFPAAFSHRNDGLRFRAKNPRLWLIRPSGLLCTGQRLIRVVGVGYVELAATTKFSCSENVIDRHSGCCQPLVSMMKSAHLGKRYDAWAWIPPQLRSILRKGQMGLSLVVIA